MRAAEILAEASRRGMTMRVDGDRLRVSCLPGSSDNEFEGLLRAHKPELVALLTAAVARDHSGAPADREHHAESVATAAPAKVAEGREIAPVPEFGVTATAIQLRSLRVSDNDLWGMLAKHDAVDRAMANAVRRGCQACGREDWYEDSQAAQRVCRHCHPPHGSRRPVAAPAVLPPSLVIPEPEPGVWACPRGHGSDPSHWRRWGCGACRLRAEAVS